MKIKIGDHWVRVFACASEGIEPAAFHGPAHCAVTLSQEQAEALATALCEEVFGILVSRASVSPYQPHYEPRGYIGGS